MHGDREAFGTLASRSLARLVGTAGLILRSHDAAEDGAQEALVRAWRDLPTLRDPDRFDAWLHRVLVRSCHDQRRQEARRSGVTARMALPVEAVPDHTSAFVDGEAIRAGLDQLTHDQRTILVLRYYLQLTQPEIAEAAGIPLGTVKSRLNRALIALQAAMAAQSRGAPPAEP